MRSFTFLFSAAALVSSAVAQGVPPYESMTTPVEYMDSNNTALLGHMAMPEGIEGTVPAVIIIPDWDGVDEYEMIRATMVMQEWGLVGFAADIYGVTPQYVANITERRELATFYRSNPEAFEMRIQAAIDAVNAMPEVETGNIALFGYCFGGTGVLQYGFRGNDNVKAVVSFHGGFSFLPEAPAPEIFNPRVLILSGGDDNTPEQIMDMEVLLDSAQAPWEITRYEGIEHAFTVWFDERYDELVDVESWNAAGDFILEAFGLTTFESAINGMTNVVNVSYTGSMDGTELLGYLAMPDDSWARPLPAIVILPDWDGVNTYEQERATALAELGYVAMAADIFGADKGFVESFDERGELVTKYITDPMLYVDRINDAIEQVKMVEGVDPEEIGIIGYCFGGSGAVLYSFFDGSKAEVAVAFHGTYTSLPPVLVEEINPYVLILSGGDDGSFGNQTLIETTMESGNADWEITRYASLGHGYTVPSSPVYNLVGDARSWTSMLASFAENLVVPQQVGSTPAPVDAMPPAPSTPAPVDAMPTDSMTPAPTPPTPSTEPSVGAPPTMDGTEAPTETTTEEATDDSSSSGVATFMAVIVSATFTGASLF